MQYSFDNRNTFGEASDRLWDWIYIIEGLADILWFSAQWLLCWRYLLVSEAYKVYVYPRSRSYQAYVWLLLAVIEGLIITNFGLGIYSLHQKCDLPSNDCKPMIQSTLQVMPPVFLAFDAVVLIIAFARICALFRH